MSNDYEWGYQRKREFYKAIMQANPQQPLVKALQAQYARVVRETWGELLEVKHVAD